MSLFQKPPTTAAELEQNRPLAIPPEEVAAMDEAEWYARAFRGEDAIQLTVRAVVMGCVLGFFLAFTNVYVGLKVGWGLGVSLTACIASFTIWSTLVRLGAARSPMTILENNCMQSTASSAGYSTTSLLVTAVPAMLLEDLRVFAAIRRSVQLTAGYRGRLFIAALLMTIIGYVGVMVFQGPFFIAAVFAARYGNWPPWLNFATAASGSIGGAITGPLLMIVLVLSYYDARIRKEAFDLQFLMSSLDHPTPPGAVPAA